MDLDPQLAALRSLGGFFPLHTGAPPHGPLPTLARAYAAPGPRDDRAPSRDGGAPDAGPGAATGRGPSAGHRDPLTLRVGRVARGIGTPEPRVAASVAQQALAARLWSAVLGCAAVYGQVPDLDAGLLRWDPAGGAPDDLWLTEVRPRPADADTVAALVLDGHLRPLAAALGARYRVAPGLLRGNAASALVGTARQLDRWARGSGRPEAAARAWDLTAHLLAHPLLAGSGTFTAPGPASAVPPEAAPPAGPEAAPASRPASAFARAPVPAPGPGAVFRRRSCCLYYRVSGAGVCGDCCFSRAPHPSPRTASGRP
ncbi:(2Fe-2S)-binding protein [Streptomyces tropicalis]|uniref:(2Fe-2S)-binding protein n=1 Tax=Streptomyces tropicalis TaxID=3034234 RepID=A0ABT6AAM8_9ACTN|nr:(2Fe-2S)-binding protein [Streptomyces tropicalis]MDF3301711.1 (2Fe-2S)-binding protein [Streptomyces tropicalis]